MSRKIKAYLDGEFPEWVGDRDGIRHLLDGVRFQYTVNEEARREGHLVPELEGLNKKEYEGLTEEQIFTELVSGCIVAYFAAMSQVLDNATFGRIVSPLADAISGALGQFGIIAEIPKDRWEPLIKEMKEKAEKNELAQAKAKAERNTDSYFHEDEDEVLKKAIESLKAAGRRLTH